MPPPNSTDRKKSRLVDISGRRFEDEWVIPERLRLLEIDAVLRLVGNALGWIEFESHGDIWYNFYTNFK